jgi:predicted membrane chloride channel (bestrophin family)
MGLRKNFHWLKVAATIQGSVIPAVFGQVVFCTSFSLLTSIL